MVGPLVRVRGRVRGRARVRARARGKVRVRMLCVSVISVTTEPP